MILFIIGGTFVYNIDLSFHNKVSLLTLANIETLAKEENILFQNQLSNIQSIAFGDSNYFDTCYFVKLETTSHSLIAEITQLEFFNHNIYIWDRQAEKILVFDSQGNYQTHIGQKGRAPEYIYNVIPHITPIYNFSNPHTKIQLYVFGTAMP